MRAWSWISLSRSKFILLPLSEFSVVKFQTLGESSSISISIMVFIPYTKLNGVSRVVDWVIVWYDHNILGISSDRPWPSRVFSSNTLTTLYWLIQLGRWSEDVLPKRKLAWFPILYINLWATDLRIGFFCPIPNAWVRQIGTPHFSIRSVGFFGQLFGWLARLQSIWWSIQWRQ